MQDSLSLVLGVLHAGARSVQLSAHSCSRFLCQVTDTGCSASPGLLTARSWPRAARTARWVLAPWSRGAPAAGLGGIWGSAEWTCPGDPVQLWSEAKRNLQSGCQGL